MHRSQGFRCVLFLCALAVAIPGCGAGSAAVPRSAEQLSIEQVGLIFRAFKKGQQPAPKSVKDVLRLEQGYPAAVAALKNKEVIVFWGASLSDAAEAASTVLAYRADVPEKGGEVLMQDGSARTMTAAEFHAAQKAAK